MCNTSTIENELIALEAIYQQDLNKKSATNFSITPFYKALKTNSRPV